MRIGTRPILSTTTMFLISSLLVMIVASDSSAQTCFSGVAYEAVGEQGTGPGQFQGPAGIGVNIWHGWIYVADSGNDRIQKLWGTGGFISMWGAHGTGDGEFDTPTDVEVGPSDEIYVVDSGNHRIQVFGPDGAYARQWGEEGSEEGQLLNPSFLSVDDHVYVADTGNHRIQKFTLDGTFVTSWGTSGTGDGEFLEPTGIDMFIDEVYVADRALGRVQVFSDQGEFIRQWGSVGSDLTQLSGPMGLSVDDCVNVADADNHRILSFTRAGTSGSMWWIPEELGSTTFYDMMGGVFCCSVGWATDYENNRLVVFVFPDPVLPTTWGQIKSKY